ncbi:MAG: Gfo/Idh/MocA family oxidoreductase [Planctomycetales bacterium]|nr:Gfo/Idh/MocA family oxidoreductase [Planctomycetales bacterium]MCA9224000.1 Gfo/Idh/MocA family oxidoreductase [Planctomycetales bacterium]
MTMNKSNTGESRREFLKTTGKVAAASALVASAVPKVHAAEDNTINVALIGCGGRGTGAAANALSVKNGPIKLVAMADVFEHKLNNSYQNLFKQFPSQVDVPDDRKFVSFDGYKQAMDCLKPGDVAIFTTPPAFRWVHFTYAIEKGLNVFMEKPVTIDGPTSKRMFELGEKANAKNLKVGVGLMCRHCKARQELYDRIQNGEIGDITLLRAYRMAGPTGSAATGPKPENMSELLYQIDRFHAFLWASGGGFSDFLIHNIDESCWMKNAWPVQAKACGGRHYRNDNVDQNFDSYSVEYTFEDGTKLYLNGRTMPGCHQEFASYAHGTKGSAIISTASHTPAKPRIFSGHNFVKKDMTWQWGAPEPNPYQVEWEDLIQAIREDKPYSEVERGVKASLVTSMGRMAAHTGQIVTYDDILNCDHEFAPDVNKLTMESPAPLLADASGKYPIPLPGLNTSREF